MRKVIVVLLLTLITVAVGCKPDPIVPLVQENVDGLVEFVVTDNLAYWEGDIFEEADTYGVWVGERTIFSIEYYPEYSDFEWLWGIDSTYTNTGYELYFIFEELGEHWVTLYYESDIRKGQTTKRIVVTTHL